MSYWWSIFMRGVIDFTCCGRSGCLQSLKTCPYNLYSTSELSLAVSDILGWLRTRVPLVQIRFLLIMQTDIDVYFITILVLWKTRTLKKDCRSCFKYTCIIKSIGTEMIIPLGTLELEKWRARTGWSVTVCKVTHFN